MIISYFQIEIETQLGENGFMDRKLYNTRMRKKRSGDREGPVPFFSKYPAESPGLIGALSSSPLIGGVSHGTGTF